MNIGSTNLGTASHAQLSWAQNFFGLATFVPLDYGSRYEYSAIVVPRDWSAMYDLIYAPQLFMEYARLSYGLGTPVSKATTQSSPPETVHWTFEDPITVVIRPLTEATQETRHILSLLNGYYDFGTILTEWNSMPVAAFRDAVINAADCKINPPHYVDHAKSGNTVHLDPWLDPFSLKFVAEFAVRTRVLHIYYIPQPMWPSDPARMGQPYYNNHVTPVTWSRVGNTMQYFLHFDVDFGKDHTYDQVAQIRAQVAMDYIVHPEVINTWIANVNMTPNPAAGATYFERDPGDSDPYNQGQTFDTGFYVTDGSLVEAGETKALAATPQASVAPQQFQRIAPVRDPRVIIDSVWPVPPGETPADMAAIWHTTPSNDPPPPYLCINIGTEGGVPGDATVKMYQPTP